MEGPVEINAESYEYVSQVDGVSSPSPCHRCAIADRLVLDRVSARVRGPPRLR